MIPRKVPSTALLAVLSLLLVTPVMYAAPDPYAPMVTIAVTLPDGKTQTIDVRDAESAVVKLANGTEYKVRPTLVDAKPWTQVVVTIFKAATAQAPDQALGEVEVKTGSPAVASKTSPVFKIAVPKVTAAPNPAEKK
jgi:hypothetical protein